MITYRNLDINGWKLIMAATFPEAKLVRRIGTNMEIRYFDREVIVGSVIAADGLYLMKIVFMITSNNEIHYGLVSSRNETIFLDDESMK